MMTWVVWFVKDTQTHQPADNRTMPAFARGTTLQGS